jgi:hypothetical protein
MVISLSSLSSPLFSLLNLVVVSFIFTMVKSKRGKMEKAREERSGFSF